MPVTASQLTKAGHYSLNANLKNKPFDQIGQDRPLLAMLMRGKRSFPGGKQYVRENVRKSYDSNFQWFSGGAQVGYNSRDPSLQAQFPWHEAHDGFTLNARELAENGVTIADSDNKTTKIAGDEQFRLIDLMDENVNALREGFEDKFDYELHRDGTQGTDALAGLDLLISTSPTTGTVGGINRATSGNEYWRNQYATSIGTPSSGSTPLIDKLEDMYRDCTRHRGRPDTILAGEDIIDQFRKEAQSAITRYLGLNGIQKGSAQAKLDPSSDLFFHGIQIVRDPTAYDLDSNSAYGSNPEFQKRLYMLSSKTFRLRPLEGQDMITHTPPWVYDRYAYYWGLTWRGALTCSQPNANGVAALS